MDLVLPQPGSFRPAEGRTVPPIKEEVLSLTIKPTEFKPSSPVKEAAETPVGQDVLKHPRRFQSLASAVPTRTTPSAGESSESLAEPNIPKHPRRFQALAAAGPAKIANRFSRREPTAEPAPPDPSTEPEAPVETLSQLQLPTAVLAALARAEAAAGNLPSASPLTVDAAARKNKERRGVPPTLQERPASQAMYDW